MAQNELGHDPTKSPHGFEDTEPANKIIFASAVVCLGLLVFLIPIFHTYFNDMTDGEIDSKIQQIDEDEDGRADYLQARNDEFGRLRDQLANNPVSIDQAIEQLATRGRNVPVVRPRRNDGLDVSVDDAVGSLGPVKGWAQREHTRAFDEAERALRARRAQEEAAREEARRRMMEAAAAAGTVDAAGRPTTVTPMRPLRPTPMRPTMRPAPGGN